MCHWELQLAAWNPWAVSWDLLKAATVQGRKSPLSGDSGSTACAVEYAQSIMSDKLISQTEFNCCVLMLYSEVQVLVHWIKWVQFHASSCEKFPGSGLWNAVKNFSLIEMHGAKQIEHEINHVRGWLFTICIGAERWQMSSTAYKHTAWTDWCFFIFPVTWRLQH